MGPLVELTLDNGHYISVTRLSTSPAADFFPGSARLSVHKGSYEMDGQSVVERTQGLVRLLELLADREALGTVLLAFSALDTLGGKGRFLCESDGLGELEAPQAFGFCEHGVVAAEDSRNVDAFGTGHAVAAACAADFFPFADDFFDFFENFEVLLGQMAGLCLRGCSAVFFHHLQGIHAR